MPCSDKTYSYLGYHEVKNVNTTLELKECGHNEVMTNLRATFNKRGPDYLQNSICNGNKVFRELCFMKPDCTIPCDFDDISNCSGHDDIRFRFDCSYGE